MLQNVSIIHPRSFCTSCHQTLVWYDLIPILSWLFLKGRCRTCHESISWLYPAIELFTVIACTLLYITVPLHYFFSYFLFFSALIVTIRTDLERMLISRYMTIFLIPVGVFFSFIGALPITVQESLLGSLLGYFILFIITRLFFSFTKKESMGQGDLDVTAFIGSFVGPVGCWISLTIASVLGSIVGLAYVAVCKKNRFVKIPFGPFLALGAIIFVLYKDKILPILFPFS